MLAGVAVFFVIIVENGIVFRENLFFIYRGLFGSAVL